jgi:imidazolonepropionase-like amidohydrolase
VVTTARIYAAMTASLSGAPAFSALEREVMRPGLERVFNQKPAEVPLPGFEAYLARAPAFDEALRKNVLTLREAQVTLLAGTDTGIPAVFPGAGLHEELKFLVGLGIPAAEVLRMATSLTARVVDPDGRRGVIEPGAVADLLLVRGDPTVDITALDQIIGVWKRGERQR